SRRRHTIFDCDWSSDVCSSDLYVDYAAKPAEALRIARSEIAVRKDIPTLDVYAWALLSNGQYDDARAALDKALKIGVRDAGLFEIGRASCRERGEIWGVAVSR